MNLQNCIKSLEAHKYIIVDRQPPAWPGQKCKKNQHCECRMNTETGRLEVSRYCFNCGKEVHFSNESLAEKMAAVGFSENNPDH